MLQFSRSSCLIGDEREGEKWNYCYYQEFYFYRFQWYSYYHQYSSYTSRLFTSRIWYSSFITLQQTYSQRKCHLRSKIRCLTEFCNSHYLSHLAAFFIDSRAKISIVMSSKNKFFSTSTSTTITKSQPLPKQHKQPFYYNDPSAGSPTETLLRLHLPLNDKIYTTSPRY